MPDSEVATVTLGGEADKDTRGVARSIHTGNEDYKLGPDRCVTRACPRERDQGLWRAKVFPDTVRDWWVYVPAQYDGTKPACVMVFQDGQACADVSRGETGGQAAG